MCDHLPIIMRNFTHMCHFPMEPPSFSSTPRTQSPLVSNPRSVAMHLWRGGDDFHCFYPLVGNHLARMVGSLDLYWVSFGKQPRYKENLLFGRTYLASPLVLTKIGFRQPRGATRLGFRRRIWFSQYPRDSRIILESLTGKYLYLQRKSLLRKKNVLFRQSNAGEKLTIGKQTKKSLFQAVR